VCIEIVCCVVVSVVYALFELLLHAGSAGSAPVAKFVVHVCVAAEVYLVLLACWSTVLASISLCT
jgi:hypothetical protein